LSTENRAVLYGVVVRQVRHFIAGSILFNQKVADRVGLHLTDMQCINLLEMLGPTTPGELARCMGLTTGGVTVMLDRLEKRGYIKREPNPGDRRSLLVRVLPKKFERLDSFYGEINRRFGAVLDETPEEDLETVIEFFSRCNAVRAELPPEKRAGRREGRMAQ
jgi:MarR family transcriptional regulator, organic hydroperoxide resistance regulator